MVRRYYDCCIHMYNTYISFHIITHPRAKMEFKHMKTELL